MSTFRPSVAYVTGDTLTDCSRRWERSRKVITRLEWRLTDGGDPARVVADFLLGFGLGIPLGRVAGRDPSVIGAELYVSAAAGAAMIGAPVGAPSPAPAVPDVVVAVHTRAGSVRPQAGGESVPAQVRGGSALARGAGPAPRAAARGEQARPLGAPPLDEPPPPLGAPVPGLGGLASAQGGPFRLGRWRASWTPAEHAEAVRAARSAIARGDVYQVNLVGHAAAAYQGDPAAALQRVAALPGARYPRILRGDGWGLACASPETLVRVEAGGRVLTRPIKGTRPATAAGRAELLASAKERAEHIMIVDLERNDLGRVARTGSVAVTELFAVRQWCDLWQAESEVAAVLDPGVGLAELLRAVCPGGSVTGAPKLAALAEIAALEPVGRGASMGALGWIGPDHLDLGLTIRTVAVDAERVHLWAGGGITWGSDPWAEVAEAAAKAAPLRAALAAS